MLVRVGRVAPLGALAPKPAVGVQALAPELPIGAAAPAVDHALGGDAVDRGEDEPPAGGSDGELGDLAPDGVEAAVDGAFALVLE